MAHLAKLSRSQILFFLLIMILSACNLTSNPEQQLSLTEIPTNISPPTRTIIPTGGVPTTLPITQIAPPTSQSLVLPPTSISLPPTFAQFPTNTPTPISIVILSPIPGNVVAGNVQVLGAAIHPLFLQYQLEYGPDPNPGNLWYPATGIVQNPVFNGLLGIWNTTVIQDSVYQLRLRVTLRDGTGLATVVNNIRIQNRVPTPVPSATPNIPRPIAAFTQDRSAGQAPLIVRFLNQSSGSITNYFWTFGDGGSTSEPNPVYTFRSPGVFTVTLSIVGPGGTSNVSQQINVQSPTGPVAAFTQDKISGPSPLNVKFTNQSTGTITAYGWTFGDGTTSIEQSPTHQFANVGTYNVILSVTGPGGTSFVTRKITVEDPVIPPPIAVFTPDRISGNVPLQVQFANQSTGQITGFAWDFGDGQTSADKNPVHTFTTAGTFTVRLIAIGPGGQSLTQTTITVTTPPNAPIATFTQNPASGNIPLNVQFTNQSSGSITAYNWDFGDGQVSTDKDPSHIYTSTGTFSVKLKVTGPGGTSEAQSTITATKPIATPVAAFTANPSTGVIPLNVQFVNQSTGESITYTWDFGDGSLVSSEVSPIHIYTTVGTYTVRLTATNAGGTNSTSQTITVSAPAVAPVASFTADVSSGVAPLNVNFSSTSTGDISAYTWDIVDNSTGGSIGSSPDAATSFSFTTAGSYTVTLTVSGPGGTNSTAQTITVSAAAIQPPPINQDVVFVSDRSGNNEIYILATDGSILNITNDGANDTSPVWSPDAARIAFVSNRDGNSEIYIMNSDGSGVERLTNDNADDRIPVWSRDGNQIIFVSNREGNNEIYTVNLDGTNLVNLTNNPANDAYPSQSPDGTRLAFMSDRDTGDNEIWILNPDGSVVNITNNGGTDTTPSWSPDGSQITFVTNRDLLAQIYVMGADGTNQRNLSDSTSTDTEPRWSSDNTQIIFISQRDGLSQIYVMDTAGANVNKVSDGSGNDTAPVWKP
jgi:PKD repeat protein